MATKIADSCGLLTPVYFSIMFSGAQDKSKDCCTISVASDQSTSLGMTLATFANTLAVNTRTEVPIRTKVLTAGASTMLFEVIMEKSVQDIFVNLESKQQQQPC